MDTIIITQDSNGNAIVTVKELKEMLDKAYHMGFQDGSINHIWTPPYSPYTVPYYNVANTNSCLDVKVTRSTDEIAGTTQKSEPSI